jgi:hypothetical protein
MTTNIEAVIRESTRPVSIGATFAVDDDRCKPAQAPAHRPGARRPGHKPKPPLPPWARERHRRRIGGP